MALAAEPRGSPAIRGGRGGGDPASQGAPGRGNSARSLRSPNGLGSKGNEKSPRLGKKSPSGEPAERGGRWWWHLSPRRDRVMSHPNAMGQRGVNVSWWVPSSVLGMERAGHSEIPVPAALGGLAG